MKKWVQCLNALVLLLTTFCAFAHERWLLTPSEVKYWQAQPLPSIYSSLSWVNVSLVVLGVVGVIFAFWLDKRSFNKLFPHFQKKLITYQPYTSFILRIGMASTLLIAAFGLIPREGVLYGTPSLFVSDLILKPAWHFLKYVEILLGVALVFKHLAPLSASLLVVLSILSVYLFGPTVFAYIGFIIGIAFYILLIEKKTIKASQSHLPQLMLQLFSGSSFIYSAIAYKFLAPNLDIGILIKENAFTFGLDYAVFTFAMGLVELSAGLLMITGTLLRPMSFFLFGCFIFLSMLMDENVFAHMFIYGILVTFFINGGSSWKQLLLSGKTAS